MASILILVPALLGAVFEWPRYVTYALLVPGFGLEIAFGWAAARARGAEYRKARPSRGVLALAALFSPARGFYVVVPPEYRSWGVLPGELFIDGMMRALGRSYYVSLLTAAAMHGASHQAPQVFQVVVDRHVPNRDIKRVRLRFYVNEHLSQMAVEERQVDTGRVRLATRETTLVDLIAHPDEAGGLNNLATVIVAIGDIDVAELARLAIMRSRSVARRLGWLLDQFRDDLDLQPLREVADTYPTRLVRALPARGPLDRRWNLQVNTNVEPDL